MTDHARDLQSENQETLEAIVEGFDPEAALRAAEAAIRKGDLE
jgi:hypothetical protein